MNIQSKSYQLTEAEFKTYLETIKSSKDTLSFLLFDKHPLYFYKDADAYEALLELEHAKEEFDRVYVSFSSFGQGQWLERFLIDDIEATNVIEEIYSTRHDIFALLRHVASTKSNEKIVSLVRSYHWILSGKTPNRNSLEELRSCYDAFSEGTIEKEDRLDGKLFRKGPVYISNGAESVHQGLYPEEKIISGMQEFLDLYNGKEPLMFRAVLSHFLLEYIHPFYDGNGRFGRYLVSAKIYEETKSPFALIFSCAFRKSKAKYYSALSSLSNPHQYGFMNEGLMSVLQLVKKHVEEVTSSMKEKRKEIEATKIGGEWTSGQKKIISILLEATALSDFGVNISEIIEATSQSKRNVIYTLKKLKSLNLLEETKIGKSIYRKVRI